MVIIWVVKIFFVQFCVFLPPLLNIFCLSLLLFWGFPCGSDGKEFTCNAGNLGLIPGLGRYPGGGNGNSLQYSCLENPMDRGTRQATIHSVTRGWTCLSNWACMLGSQTYTQTRGTSAAAAKSLQSCPTLCNPIDGSPPRSPIPGILQARILEWVALRKAFLSLLAVLSNAAFKWVYISFSTFKTGD